MRLHVIIIICLGMMSARPLGLWSQSLPTDSNRVAQDSTPKKIIPPNTRRVYPQRIFAQDFELPRAQESFFTFDKWDNLDTLKGWVNELGLVGKPYRHTRFGVNDRWLGGAGYRNPLTDNRNLYLLAPEEARYYDTKTPYTRVDFAQGPQQTGKLITLLDIIASYNFHPLFNLTGYYKRRQAQSIYGGDANSTDNRLIHLNGYYHDFSHRYELFTNFQYNEFYNFFHGGVFRPVNSDDADYFQKGIDIPNFRNTLGRWLVRSAYADQYYHLWKRKDSTRLNQQLTLRNTLLYDYSNYIFTATNLSRGTLDQNWIAPLPTLKNESSEMQSEPDFRKMRVGVEAHYEARLKEWLNLSVQGGTNYQNLIYRKQDSNYKVVQNRWEQKVNGKISIPKLLHFQYNTDFHTRPNNLFKPETYWENTVSFRPILYFGKKDSTRRAHELEVSATQLLHDQNPSLFQTYFKAGIGSNFTPNPNLRNQQLNQIRVKIAWKSAPQVRVVGNKTDTLLANYLETQPFISNISQMIYYNDSLQLFQAPSGSTLTYTGIELGGRVRYFRKMYLEGQICLQNGSVSDSLNGYFWKYSQNLPRFYGRIGTFYQNDKVMSFKGILRLGMELKIGSPYLADAIDPVSGEFFPTTNSYQMNYYPRIDFLFATKVKRAYIFFKLINVADGLITPGNYTTPFYPVLPRMLTAGINWTFFD